MLSMKNDYKGICLAVLTALALVWTGFFACSFVVETRSNDIALQSGIQGANANIKQIATWIAGQQKDAE